MSEPKSFARHLPSIGRWVLGLPAILFGLMDLFHPMPSPPDMPVVAKQFADALAASGYMMPMIGIVLAGSGALLVSNRFVPLALLLLAPFWVNSLLFHAFLAPAGLPMVAIFVALELALAWAYRGVFASVLRAKNAPGPG